MPETLTAILGKSAQLARVHLDAFADRANIHVGQLRRFGRCILLSFVRPVPFTLRTEQFSGSLPIVTTWAVASVHRYYVETTNPILREVETIGLHHQFCPSGKCTPKDVTSVLQWIWWKLRRSCPICESAWKS